MICPRVYQGSNNPILTTVFNSPLKHHTYQRDCAIGYSKNILKNLEKKLAFAEIMLHVFQSEKEEDQLQMSRSKIQESFIFKILIYETFKNYIVIKLKLLKEYFWS